MGLYGAVMGLYGAALGFYGSVVMAVMLVGVVFYVGWNASHGGDRGPLMGLSWCSRWALIGLSRGSHRVPMGFHKAEDRGAERNRQRKCDSNPKVIL